MKEHQNNQHSIFFKRVWGGELYSSETLMFKKKKKERFWKHFWSKEVKETQLNAIPNPSLEPVLQKGKNSIKDIPPSTDKNRKQVER